MRLDKFLVFARFVKTRSQAQALLGQTGARINGRPISTVHAEVRIGSVITVALGGQVRIIRVEQLPARRGAPAEARACYVDLAIDAGAAGI